MKIKFSYAATRNFEAAVRFIHSDSPKNAENFAIDIIKKIEELKSDPARYPPDKFKRDNDGSYRAFELHHYRIAYRILTQEIRIIRLRHTSMEPSEH